MIRKERRGAGDCRGDGTSRKGCCSKKGRVVRI